MNHYVIKQGDIKTQMKISQKNEKQLNVIGIIHLLSLKTLHLQVSHH